MSSVAQRVRMVEQFRDVTRIVDDCKAVSCLDAKRWQLEEAILDVVGNSDADDNGSAPTVCLKIRFGDSLLVCQASDSDSVGKVAVRVAAALSLPVKAIKLTGWNKDSQVEHTELLKDLLSSQQEELQLALKESFSFKHKLPSIFHLDNQCLLLIVKPRGLRFMLQASKRTELGDLKSVIGKLLGVGTLALTFIGLGAGAKDDQLLVELNLNVPIHSVEVTVKERSEDTDSGEDGGVIELIPQLQHGRMCLVEIVSTDHEWMTRKFRDEFRREFGVVHPDFVLTTLMAAVEMSGSLGKPVAILLHDHRSVQANICCVNVLTNVTFLAHMNDRFIVWPWDVTLEANRDHIFGVISTIFGSHVVDVLRNWRRDQYPIIVMAYKGLYCRVVDMFEIGCSLETSLEKLQSAYEAYEAAVDGEHSEEEARHVPTELRAQQEQAFRVALAEGRRHEEAARLADQAQQFREAEERAERERCAASLPPEPPENTAGAIHLRFRLPGSRSAGRRFMLSDTVNTLTKYMGSIGYPKRSYCLMTNAPKRDLLEECDGKTLNELGLARREVLYVEEKEMLLSDDDLF